MSTDDANRKSKHVINAWLIELDRGLVFMFMFMFMFMFSCSCHVCPLFGTGLACVVHSGGLARTARVRNPDSCMSSVQASSISRAALLCCDVRHGIMVLAVGVARSHGMCALRVRSGAHGT